MKNNIRKTVALFLAVVAAFSFSACETESGSSPSNDSSSTVNQNVSSDAESNLTSENSSQSETSSDNKIGSSKLEAIVLSGRYYANGTESGYEFSGDKVIAIKNGKKEVDNGDYEVNGSLLHIIFVGDGVEPLSLKFELSEDRNTFTYSDYSGTYIFIKQ